MFGPPDATTQPTWPGPVPRVKRRRGTRPRRSVNPRSTRHSASPELRMAVLLRDGMRCQLCGTPLTLNDPNLPTHGHAGHIVSHLDGGRVEASNLRAECADCSHRGGARLASIAVARRAAVKRQQALEGISWG